MHLPPKLPDLAEFQPQIIFQSTWSRGGDAVVVNRTIKNVGDLKEKKWHLPR
jgi:hypothetical protein